MLKHGDSFSYLERITHGAVCAQSTPIVKIYTALASNASNIFLLHLTLITSKTQIKRLNRALSFFFLL